MTFAKLMFLQMSVCPLGVCVAEGAWTAGERAWQGGVHGEGVRDTVNERAVRILLECILVERTVFPLQ